MGNRQLTRAFLAFLLLVSLVGILSTEMTKANPLVPTTPFPQGANWVYLLTITGNNCQTVDISTPNLAHWRFGGDYTAGNGDSSIRIAYGSVFWYDRAFGIKSSTFPIGKCEMGKDEQGGGAVQLRIDVTNILGYNIVVEYDSNLTDTANTPLDSTSPSPSPSISPHQSPFKTQIIDTSWTSSVTQYLNSSQPYPEWKEEYNLNAYTITLFENGTSTFVNATNGDSFSSYLLDIMARANGEMSSVSDAFLSNVSQNDKVVYLRSRLGTNFTQAGAFVWDTYFVLEDNLYQGSLEGTIFIEHDSDNVRSWQHWAILLGPTNPSSSPSLTLTPSPTIPEFPSLIILPFLVVVSLLVYLRRRRD